ncbi:transposase [Thermosynechococcaceae cyanobacterium Okahandja]
MYAKVAGDDQCGAQTQPVLATAATTRTTIYLTFKIIAKPRRAVMEGINNKLKLIKRQAYGFANFDNFRAPLLACFCH